MAFLSLRLLLLLLLLGDIRWRQRTATRAPYICPLQGKHISFVNGILFSIFSHYYLGLLPVPLLAFRKRTAAAQSYAEEPLAQRLRQTNKNRNNNGNNATDGLKENELQVSLIQMLFCRVLPFAHNLPFAIINSRLVCVLVCECFFVSSNEKKFSGSWAILFVYHSAVSLEPVFYSVVYTHISSCLAPFHATVFVVYNGSSGICSVPLFNFFCFGHSNAEHILGQFRFNLELAVKSPSFWAPPLQSSPFQSFPPPSISRTWPKAIPLA